MNGTESQTVESQIRALLEPQVKRLFDAAQRELAVGIEAQITMSKNGTAIQFWARAGEYNHPNRTFEVEPTLGLVVEKAIADIIEKKAWIDQEKVDLDYRAKQLGFALTPIKEVEV